MRKLAENRLIAAYRSVVVTDTIGWAAVENGSDQTVVPAFTTPSFGTITTPSRMQ